jgi:catechol O-methyltransferase
VRRLVLRKDDYVRKLSEIGGKRLPFLRWSALRMALGLKHLTTEWQVGDGREEALANYVAKRARPGDVDDAIGVIDEFCYERSIMMNVGDEKGLLLDAAVRRANPRLLLELGTYCGYSALRTARVMPGDARLCSIEVTEANASIARRIVDHAGASDRVTVVVGTLADGGKTLDRLASDHDFSPGSLDFMFIDHEKSAYLPDLERVLNRGWLHPGAIVVADNVKVPGAPEYRAYMREEEGRTWRTVEHETHVEYQTLIRDLVLESEYLGEVTTPG